MRYSAKQINTALEEIHKELDITFATEYHYVQQTFSELIVPYNKPNAGTVRTYGQVVKYLQDNAEKYGQKYQTYTQQEYNKQMSKLSSQIGQSITVQGAEHQYRQGAEQLLDDYNKWSGGSVNLWEIDFQTLKRIIDQATEDTGKRSKDRNDSPKLFRNMHHYFEEEGFRTHGDIPEDYA